MDKNDIVERDRYGGGSIMIWGRCHSGKTELVTINGSLNAHRYCDEIITAIVIPYTPRGRADILQQHNARCHVAHHTTALLQQSNIQTRDWPVRFPDLSPIEHLLDHLGRVVRQRHNVNNTRKWSVYFTLNGEEFLCM